MLHMRHLCEGKHQYAQSQRSSHKCYHSQGHSENRLGYGVRMGEGCEGRHHSLRVHDTASVRERADEATRFRMDDRTRRPFQKGETKFWK